MEWVLNDDRPIYQQLAEQIKINIVTGKLEPGDKMPSVRELALDAGVNPNTMQRALAELERENLLYSQRTSGRFITEDEELIDKIKEDLAKNIIEEFLNSMMKLSFDKNSALQLVERILREEL